MTLTSLLVNLICLFLGCAAGYFTAQWQNKHHVKDVAPPLKGEKSEVPRKIRGVLGVLLFLMAIFIVFQTQSIADQRAKDAEVQGECNDEFFRVLSERTKITADDNALNRSDATALQTLVEKLLATPPEAQTAETTFAALREYSDTTDMNNEKRAQNDKERAANPYPEPRCGN